MGKTKRRTRLAGLTGALLALGVAVSACGGSNGTSSTSQSAGGGGKPVRGLEFNADDRKIIRGLGLITAKKVLYVANVDEGDDGVVRLALRHLLADDPAAAKADSGVVAEEAYDLAVRSRRPRTSTAA